MSEFMKNIVQEVLKPTNKPRENPIFSGSGSVYSKSTVNTNNRDDSKQTISAINRPNYQQKNIQKRLAGLSVNASKAENLQASKNEFKKDHFKQDHKESYIGSLSKLQTISLVQGYQSPTKVQPSSKGKGNNEESQFIGQTRNGIKAWVYSGLSEKLLASFQRPLKSHSIGVISSEGRSIGQLFLVNDILREYSTMKYSLIWDKEATGGFVLELYEENTAKLTVAVKTLFQKLSQHSAKSLQLYKVQSPSPWLIKQLSLSAHVDGIAVIDGIEQYSSILLVDRYVKKNTNIGIHYSVEKDFLLLCGPFLTISEVADELLMQAERIK